MYTEAKTDHAVVKTALDAVNKAMGCAYDSDKVIDHLLVALSALYSLSAVDPTRRIKDCQARLPGFNAPGNVEGVGPFQRPDGSYAPATHSPSPMTDGPSSEAARLRKALALIEDEAPDDDFDPAERLENYAQSVQLIAREALQGQPSSSPVISHEATQAALAKLNTAMDDARRLGDDARSSGHVMVAVNANGAYGAFREAIAIIRDAAK